jgi:DivIVA domain-containing protein
MNESPQEIRQKTFSVTRRGYDRAEVASYLAVLASDLSGSQPDQIRQKTFSVTRRGYDKAEVASYLARIAYELEQDTAEAQTAPADEPASDGADVAHIGIDADADDSTEDDEHRAFVAALTDESGDDPAFGDVARPGLAEAASVDDEPEVVAVAEEDEISFADETEVAAVAEEEEEEEEEDEISFADETEVAAVAEEDEISFADETEVASADDDIEVDVVEAEPEEDVVASTEIDHVRVAALPAESSYITSALPDVPAAETRPKLPSLPPLPEIPSVAPMQMPATTGGTPMSFDDDGFQQAASEITSLMRQAHEGALRLRAQAESEVRTAIDATETELNERRRVQLEHLDLQRGQAEQQITDAREVADKYAAETKTRADRYINETRAEADAYADRIRTQADTDAKALTAEAESYARATNDNADDYDRRTRSDADSYSTRIRADGETSAKQVIDEAENIGVELRATAAKEKAEAASALETAQSEAESIRRAGHDEADHILGSAQENALSRSNEILERGRALVQSLASLESDSRRRLVEAQQAINSALDATTVSQLPDADLNSRIAELSAELEDLDRAVGEADAG